MPDVVLFRTRTEPDSYGTLLSTAGLSSTSIPALGEELTTAELLPILAAGVSEWEGVICTSRRAAEAWVRAVGELESQGRGNRDGASDSNSDTKPWSDLAVYSPGTAVGGVLSSLAERWCPKPVTAISAAALSPIVLSAPPRSGNEEYGPYLMLVGDKTLPTLPTALAGAGRTVQKVRVYTTSECPSLAAAVGDLDPNTAWAVLFSPSSAGFVLPHLEKAQWGVRAQLAQERRPLRVAAIGETTAAFLRQEGYRCDAVASTPDSHGVLKAICEADAQLPRAGVE